MQRALPPTFETIIPITTKPVPLSLDAAVDTLIVSVHMLVVVKVALSQ